MSFVSVENIANKIGGIQYPIWHQTFCQLIGTIQSELEFHYLHTSSLHAVIFHIIVMGKEEKIMPKHKDKKKKKPLL